jgi:hypothetical protein
MLYDLDITMDLVLYVLEPNNDCKDFITYVASRSSQNIQKSGATMNDMSTDLL